MNNANRALDEWDRVEDLYSSDARLAFLRGYAAATAASDALLLSAVKLALAEAAQTQKGRAADVKRIRAIPPQLIVDRAKENDERNTVDAGEGRPGG